MATNSQKSYATIVLSPHYDDASFSVGGYLIRQVAAGRDVHVLTIMAADAPASGLSPFAQEHHDRWELSDNPVAVRRAEDIESMRILGASYTHAPVRDCIYRVHPETGAHLYTDMSQLFGTPNEGEAQIIDQLREIFLALPSADEVLVPLGIGSHVDHQWVRRAAETTDLRLRYYEDYPYIRPEGAIESFFETQTGRWESETIPLSPADLDQKVASIAAYGSQISTFFKDERNMRDQVTEFYVAHGGERLWEQS